MLQTINVFSKKLGVGLINQNLIDMLKIRNTILLGLFAVISCCTEEQVEIPICGCDGKMENEVIDTDGRVIYFGRDLWQIQADLGSSNITAFEPCNLEDQYKIDSLDIVFSGKYNRPCHEKPTSYTLMITSIK